MKETDAIDEYILQHIDEESDYLKALYRDTHVKLLRPRMASGHLQGRMLKMFVQMIRPRQVLEIGTYSGYSALCLAEGLEEGATLHTFEINDEQEDFTRRFRSRKLLVLYIKSHIYTKFNTPKNLPNPLHLALLVSTLSHSPEIRRIKKHAEKWSEATSINQKRNTPLLYGNF